MPPEVDTAADADLAELADLAAATFPLACPPTAQSGDIAAFIAANLSAERFGGYLDDADRRVLVAREAGRIVGYAMVIRGVGDDPDVAAAVQPRPAVELSKFYVAPSHHGAGAAPALMGAAIGWAGQCGAEALWLGVNCENQRAQRFYCKHGFEVTGTRTFRLADSMENDFVMVRSVH